MRKVMLAGLAVVVVMATVAAFGVKGTLTWFSGTENRSVSVSTATIDLDAIEGVPITISNLMPSETQTVTVKVKNVGTGTADFYVQMLSSGGAPNFCSPSVLDIKIRNVTDVWTPYPLASICPLFPGWGGSTIVKIADDVDPDVVKRFDVDVHLSTAAGNVYQGVSRTDTVRLIAVQSNGPAPIPDKQGGLVQDPWPADTTLPDDDTNYP